MSPDPSYYQHISELADRTPPPIGQRGAMRDRHRLKRTIVIGVLGFVAALAVTFVLDYVVLRYRIAARRNPFATVEMQNYYAIHKKGGKTELTFAGNQTETCVNSVFPHLGYTPCWYLRRHADRWIDL